MTMNARMSSNDSRLYNPNRDVAHNFKAMAMEVAKRCEANTWTALAILTAEKQVTPVHLGQALQAFLTFLAIQMDDPKAGMATCLDRAGWFAVPEYARVIVMAQLGAVMLGAHWSGVRETTIGGQGPALDYQDLAAYGREAAVLMAMSPLRRRWLRVRYRVRQAWAALFSSYAFVLDVEPVPPPPTTPQVQP